MSEKPHSWYVMDDHRLGWWSEGQLTRFIENSGVDNCKSVLDVGCGAGHWTESLLNSLPCLPDKVLGFDIEKKWLDQFEHRIRRMVSDVSILEGDVHKIPPSLRNFDLVTCQTVLMHCHDPQKVLRNMISTIRPGGYCIIAESLNQINRSVLCESLASRDYNSSDLLWSFWNAFHEQKIRDGSGDNNIAVRLPGLLHEAGFVDVAAVFNERVEFESAPFRSLDELTDEMRVPETRSTIERTKISVTDVQSVAAAFNAIKSALNFEKQTVAHCVPMMLFSCRRPVAG